MNSDMVNLKIIVNLDIKKFKSPGPLNYGHLTF